MGKSLVLVFHKEQNGLLFEKTILALRKKYTLVSAPQLEELMRQEKEPQNICHISFDDGERSFYNTIFPLLKKHDVPVSLFVSPQVISSGANYWFQEMEGYDEQLLKNIIAGQVQIPVHRIRKYHSQLVLLCLPIEMINRVITQYRLQTNSAQKVSQNINVAQLQEIVSSGLVTVGAHTMQHPVLTNEDDETCGKEISASITALELLIGKPVNYFAYPNGRPGMDFGDREKKILAENNISLAFSTELEHISSSTDPLSIPRMGFARMGLSPSNPLVLFRLNAGKKWIDIRSVGKPTEYEVRKKIKKLLNG